MEKDNLKLINIKIEKNKKYIFNKKIQILAIYIIIIILLIIIIQLKLKLNIIINLLANIKI